MTGLSDSFHRPIDYLRISVTDRCNLRCRYCMPSSGVRLMPRDNLLTYEEIGAVARAAAELGISKLKLTGGEPLVRFGLSRLVQMLATIKGIDDISLTTNGILLNRHAAELGQAGLRRVNVSLDTLKPEKFETITRSQYPLRDVLEGIEAARRVGLNPVKLNTVVMAGVNDDELVDFASRTIDDGWHVRFIELMPFTESSTSRFISVSDMIKRIESPLGSLEPGSPGAGNGPARYFRLPHARGTIGFITPVSEHFCINCNRLRLTSDGKLRPCLLSASEINLRRPLRNGDSREELKRLIREAIASKPLRHHLAEGYVPKDRPFSQVGG